MSIQYAINVIWDSTLRDVEFCDSNSPLSGLAQRAVKITTGVPNANNNRFIAGATIQNSFDGTQYINAGTSASTDWQLMTSESPTANPIIIQLSCSDLTTDLSEGDDVAYIRVPVAMIITEVRASLLVAQPSGAEIQINIRNSTESIFDDGSRLEIDSDELTSLTATQPTLVGGITPDDEPLYIDIEQVGDAGAKGLIVTIIGTPS